MGNITVINKISRIYNSNVTLYKVSLIAYLIIRYYIEFTASEKVSFIDENKKK